MNRPESIDRESTLALVEAMLCGEITPEESQRLEELLHHSDAARLIFVEHMDLQAEMLRLAGYSRPIPAAPLMRRRVGGGGVRAFAWSLVATAAAALMLVPAVIEVIDSQTRKHPTADTVAEPIEPGPHFVVAHLVTAVDAEWGEEMAESRLPIGTELRAGDWVELVSGSAVLELRSGVQCVLSGETMLSFDASQNCYLDSGLATFVVPPQAVGFTVNATGGSFIDRGTEFGVSAAPMGGSEVHVFKGAVDAQADVAGGDAQVLRLSEQRSALLNPYAESVTPTAFKAEKFRVPLSVAAGIERFSGQVRFVSQPLDSIVPAGLSGRDTVFLCREKSSVVLKDDLIVGGRFDFLAKGDPSPGRELPAGTRLNSFLLHFTPGTENTVDGAITFLAPIAGVIVDGKALAETDSLFADEQTALDQSLLPLRSVEEPPFTIEGDLDDFDVRAHDRISLEGPDRRRLSFRLKGSKVDQVRILVHADSQKPQHQTEQLNDEE